MKWHDRVRSDGVNTSVKSKILHGQKRIPKGSRVQSIQSPK